MTIEIVTPDLITALQTHGQQHKGTDLGGVLQWADSLNDIMESL